VTGTARALNLSPWGRLVAASGALVAGAALLLAGWSVASARERRVSYEVRGSINGLDRYAFGHHVRTSRWVSAGIFRLRARCPQTAITRSCSVSYRLLVPDNVPVTIRTASGHVRFHDYRGSARVKTDSGSVDVESYCGFSLDVRSAAGNVGVDASCAPQRLSLRTTSGSIHAVVPSGRYRVDADSSAGSTTVQGLTDAPDALFELHALSTSGSVRVESRE
jgi:hypothetical protein